ncbi:MAG: hypothetical protein IJY99_03085 [Alphaproteobacteria bacterium]|nr:hypothetical protein [Alphaproteobacteria bacterium]
MKSQNGSIALNIMSILAVGALIALVYVLWTKDTSKEQKTPSEYIPQPERTQPKYEPNNVFTDGLTTPKESTEYELDDMGAGIASTDVYYQDINGDGVQDRITKTRNENGTAHYWEDYKIELNQNGRWRNITPDGFRTTEGAECSLQKIQFVFKPKFEVIKISRPWRESWTTPSMATKTIYKMQGDKLVAESTQEVGEICDVAELF